MTVQKYKNLRKNPYLCPDMEDRRNLYELLQEFRKPDLADIGSIFGRELPARMRKAEMARELSVYLTGSPAEWLDFMLERDLMLLSRLVDMGPGQRLRLNYPDYPTVLEMTGIVDWDDSDEDFHQVWLGEEMWRVVRPHVARAIRRGRDSGRFTLERLMFGYANLYGIMPYDMFLDRVIDYFERTFGPDLQLLVPLLHRNPFLKLCRYTAPDGSGAYLLAPGVEDVDAFFDKFQNYKDIKEFRSFTDEDAFDAGAGAPYLTFGLDTPQGKALVELLLRLGYEGDDLAWEEHEIWMCAQDPDENPALFDSVVRRSDRIASQTEYDRAMAIIADYANAMPKWLLKGHSADETGLLLVAVEPVAATDGEEDGTMHWEMPHPTISEGYSDLIETNPRLDALISMMPEGFPFGMAIPHVAEDDPCPCGSGLKYGHCHGRNKS